MKSETYQPTATLYRFLRKLVKQGYLAKNIHHENPILSIFVETESMNEFRKQF